MRVSPRVIVDVFVYGTIAIGELHCTGTCENLTPTVFGEDGYRFFFFLREEERMHVHVVSGDGVAKFWLGAMVMCFAYSAAILRLSLRPLSSGYPLFYPRRRSE